MTIACEKQGDILVARLQGQLNSVNAAAAEAEVLGQVDQGNLRVALDFRELDYISSAGLRVVLVLAKRLQQGGGRLALFGLRPHVREVFDISGFLALLTVVDTEDEALARLA